MRELIWGLALLAGLSVPARRISAGRGQTAPHWLMMVGTRCTDSRREADFNAW